MTVAFACGGGLFAGGLVEDRVRSWIREEAVQKPGRTPSMRRLRQGGVQAYGLRSSPLAQDLPTGEIRRWQMTLSRNSTLRRSIEGLDAQDGKSRQWVVEDHAGHTVWSRVLMQRATQEWSSM